MFELLLMQLIPPLTFKFHTLSLLKSKRKLSQNSIMQALLTLKIVLEQLMVSLEYSSPASRMHTRPVLARRNSFVGINTSLDLTVMQCLIVEVVSLISVMEVLLHIALHSR